MCLEIRSPLTRCAHHIVVLLIYCREPLIPFSPACPRWRRQIIISDDSTTGWCQNCAESPRIIHNDLPGACATDDIESVVHELAAEAVVPEVEGRMVNGVFPWDSDYEDDDTATQAGASA